MKQREEREKRKEKKRKSKKRKRKRNEKPTWFEMKRMNFMMILTEERITAGFACWR